jgi:hypothetical protein
MSIFRPIVLSLAKILPACNRVTRLMSDGLDRRLTVRERVIIVTHKWICLFCARFERQAALLHTAARSADEAGQDQASHKLSDGDKADIIAVLRTRGRQ